MVILVLSQKKKILACNFTSNNVYDFPIKGISSINYDCDYEYFKKRLDRIFKISVKKYFEEVKFKNNYDLNCNKKNQTIQKINKILKEYLESFHHLMIQYCLHFYLVDFL